MKVNITDSATFEALNPSNIEKYLISRQWREVKRIDGEAALWVKSQGEKYSRILLPLDSNLGDFALSMSHVVSTLAQVENRSQLEVLEDFDTLAIGEEVKLEGYVIKLEQKKQHDAGVITVSDRALDNKYKVKIELNASDYEMAVQAHQNWWEISCQGELIKEGNYYRLYNPINFVVSKEE